jgi:pyruvate dehydrogenase E1 component alpha subunit
MADPDLYRPKEEIERWKLRDPVTTFIVRLQESGKLSDEELADIERRVAGIIDEAVEFAESSPWEPVEDLLKYVMTD